MEGMRALLSRKQTSLLPFLCLGGLAVQAALPLLGTRVLCCMFYQTMVSAIQHVMVYKKPPTSVQ
jgi:hypothetical protein